MSSLLSAVVFLWATSGTASAKPKAPPPAPPPAPAPAPAAAPVPAKPPGIDTLTKGWPERPMLAALQMHAKYGMPQESTSERLIWNNQGPFLRIEVTKAEVPHDFPKPHMDYLEHTIRYNAPEGKNEALIAFDGSVTVDRTAGELSAKCDLEGHNILTLNLANDVATGKASADAARKTFSQTVVDDALGKKPPYVMALQFEPNKDKAPDADVPTIPGSPKRPAADQAANAATPGDAEILASLVALNENEILAAMEAEQRKGSAEVLAFATMMHTQHGENLAATMKLGQTLKVTPAETKTVDAMRVKGAGELARLLQADAGAFDKGFMDLVVKGHTEALANLDTWTAAAKDPALKKHLTDTRGHVAMHLEEAKKLSGAPASKEGSTPTSPPASGTSAAPAGSAPTGMGSSPAPSPAPPAPPPPTSPKPPAPSAPAPK